MKEAIRRDMAEVRRVRLPLEILARELRWEEEHVEVTGAESSEGLANLGVLWGALKQHSSLFENDVLTRNAGGDELVEKVAELRGSIMKRLNTVYKLLTEAETDHTIAKRIKDASSIASEICKKGIPRLAADLKALSEYFKKSDK